MGLGLFPPEVAPSTPPPLMPPPDVVPFGFGDLELVLIKPAPFFRKENLTFGVSVGLQGGSRRSLVFTVRLDRCCCCPCRRCCRCCFFDFGGVVVPNVVATPAGMGSLEEGVVGLRFLSSRCCCFLHVGGVVVTAVVAPPAMMSFLEPRVVGLWFLGCRHLTIAPVVPVELRGLATYGTLGAGFHHGECSYTLALFWPRCFRRTETST